MSKITEKFCTHCGAQLTDEAVFCHICGSKIEIVKGVPAATPMEQTPSAAPAKAYAQPTGPVQPVYRRPKTLGVAIGVIAIIVVPIILIGVFGTIRFADIGTLNYEVDSMAETNIVLNIDNAVGSVDISYDVTMTKLFEATLDVKGRPGSSLADAKNFNSFYESGEYLELTFDSGDQQFFFWNKRVFSYDITIRLHPDALVDYSILTSTGSSSLVANGLDNLEIPDIYFSASTGRVTIDLSGSVNTTIQDLDLATSTGRISVNLGERTLLNTTNVDFSSSTGSITLVYADLILTGDIEWNIQASTGTITMIITQDLVLPLTYLASFDVDCSTGSISLSIAYNSTIGYAIEGAASTGTVDILGSGSYYESPGYDSAANQNYFDLETSTGSVTAVEI